MNEEYEQRQFWDLNQQYGKLKAITKQKGLDQLPVFRVTEILDMKIGFTADPIFPWLVINPQENGHRN